MAEDHQGVGLEDLQADVDRLQDFAGDRHAPGRMAAQPVAHQQRRVDHCIGEAVLDGAGKGRDRLLALAGIERAGVGEEAVSPQGPDPVDDPPDKGWAEVGMSAAFAEVQLDGGQVALTDHSGEAGGVQQAFQLVVQVLPESRTQVGEMDNTGHGGLPVA